LRIRTRNPTPVNQPDTRVGRNSVSHGNARKNVDVCTASRDRKCIVDVAEAERTNLRPLEAKPRYDVESAQVNGVHYVPGGDPFNKIKGLITAIGTTLCVIECGRICRYELRDLVPFRRGSKWIVPVVVVVVVEPANELRHQQRGIRVPLVLVSVIKLMGVANLTADFKCGRVRAEVVVPSV